VTTLSAADALVRLKQGNERYVQNLRSVESLIGHTGHDFAVKTPFAIVLGCSDARAPAEIVFDQGLGDLFVIRVAGNIVAPSQIGSVEFAAERFGTRLVVVMGHTLCGAIEATVEAMIGGPHASKNVRSIVDRVRPSLDALIRTDLREDPVRLRREAVRANVRASANHLRHGSEIIERLADTDGLVVVGAELDVKSGAVEFLE
jgi:carbonic anhydrase